MKISELSRRAGLPIPTIKFYIREGLLPPGERTAQNQAQYTEMHLSLLELARTLKDDLGLSVPTVARIMAADPRRGPDFLDAGLAAIAASRRGDRELDRQSDGYRKAATFARKLFDRAGFQPPSEDVTSEDVIAALRNILRVWPAMFQLEVVENYVRLAKELAEFEIPEEWDPEADPLGAFKYAVLGTYLFEPLILALRRVAHAERAAALARARASKVKGVGARASTGKSERKRAPRRSKTR